MEGSVHWLLKFEKSWGLMLNCWNQVIPKFLGFIYLLELVILKIFLDVEAITYLNEVIVQIFNRPKKIPNQK